MGYVRAEDILPLELIELLQQYIDGAAVYIPRKEENRVSWGQNSGSKAELQKRDRMIYQEYMQGFSVKKLAEKYYLSDKSIWRILQKMKTVT